MAKDKIFGKHENLFYGYVPLDLLELSKRLPIAAKANQWHDIMQEEIEKLGYITRREVSIKLPNGRKGRIDLVVYKENGFLIAIELDYRTPRKKSILKVREFGNGMVLLRDPKIVEVNVL